MVYGKILFNNIKEYTPKWYPTIPYSQTIKPTFVRKPQVVSSFNSTQSTKRFWRGFAFVFQRHSWMWQIFIVSVAAFTYYLVEIPMLSIYQANNKHRTFEAAMNREKAYKKKMRELEEGEEE